MRSILLLAASIGTITIAGCQSETQTAPETPQISEVKTSPVVEAPKKPSAPTPQEAKEFLKKAEEELAREDELVYRMSWVQNNFINVDSNYVLQTLSADYAKLSTRLANEAKRFNDLELPADMKRKLNILKTRNNFPAPDRDGAAEKLSELSTEIASTYSTGKFEYKGAELTLGQLSDIIASSRDPEELQSVWEGWRKVSPVMKGDYAKLVEIANEGSRELGFKDTGDLWRGGYDMDAEAFAAEADRLWGQVKPLYDQLHCYVRAGLNEEYGNEIVPMDQPIRADLLGNMWAQSWGNVYSLVAPKNAGNGVDITQLLQERKAAMAMEKDSESSEPEDIEPAAIDDDEPAVIDMVKTAEDFFVSMGFEPLPETFWERSLFVKPADREVACHASAWDVDNKEDLRIKMCTKLNGEDFVTVHHELGHNFYQRAYMNQPFYYKNGANDGFHEAIGDMIALSITPKYLVEIGLLDADNVPGEEEDIALLMRQAMDKIAFLPFGIMIDQWRWKVFSGEYSPSEYNSGWWELREKYQGIRPPSERPSDAFDPGAKYHIPNNVPYMRYFLAHILQFQFHKAACDIIGNDGPLHRCSVYGSKEVGDKFQAMLEMGSSKPWPDALEAFTGTRDMDGSAVIEYFAPLMSYLEAQNEERSCGW